jgi:hypothetical protein
MTNGSCLCGALRYQIDGPFSAMMNCHCSMCRKEHGSLFATYAVAPATGLRWIAGEDRVARYRSSAHGVRAFCPTCGSAAPGVSPEMGIVFAPAGNLEGDLGITPQRHIFVGSKAPWYSIPDGLPQHEAYPPDVDFSPTERPVVTPRAGVTDGSCLCGEIAFEISGPAQRAMNCHCSRCRRGRGAAHATNIFYAIDSFRWTRGEALVTGYKVPEARFHAVAFCSRCGSKLPRISTDRGVVIVPAGSLDTDPGIQPAAHIFVADKAPWFRIADSLPQFAQMPPA